MTHITEPSSRTIKCLYSYGGKIRPRKTDGKLRYVGGHTRVLAVDRSITYAELIVKFWEASGFSVNLKCKLPTEDLDVLVSITGDEDLAAIVEEYDRVSSDVKIRAILFPVESLKRISPVSSAASLVDFPVPRYPLVANIAVGKGTQRRPVLSKSMRCVRFRFLPAVYLSALFMVTHYQCPGNNYCLQLI